MPNKLTLTEASFEIQTGRLDPVDLLEACLDQIDALEDRLLAWVTLDREGAADQARKLKEELAGGRPRGPLHGIPIGIKDIMYTQGMRTSSGSAILRDFVPDYDATVVSRLREAGAVILGKTVTTEFACFDPPETLNPWNLAHTPGGSSSGTAAAVAARMCPAALGSQTGGSISRPAIYCGIAGCKPTYGRVSVHGVHPVAFSLDHPGVLARSVPDVALVLRTIAGPDAQDPLCADIPVSDYAAAVAQMPERPPRIGLIRAYFEETADEASWGATADAADCFRSEGAEVREVALPDSFKDLHRMHRVIMCAEAAAVHADQFARRKADYRPSIASVIEEGLSLSAVDYARARTHQVAFRWEMQSAFEDVDVLLTPATLTPAPRDLGTTGDPAFNSPWSYTGLPTFVLPTATAPNGLPVGVQFVGRAFGESDLLASAAWCENRLGWDGEPQFVSG